MNQLTVLEYLGQRVLTTSQLAESYETDTDYVNRNFNNNKDRYQLGKHFFLLEGDELKEFKMTTGKNDGSLLRVNKLYLWTEKGAWLHAKSLNTDRAWEAYDALVDDYYRVKQAGVELEGLSPLLQLMIQTEQRQKALEATQQHQATQIETIKETFLERDEDWRNKMNALMKGAAFRKGGNYQELRRRSYDILEERARCDLDKRLRNLVERLELQGATKTQLRNTSRMTVIEADPRLKEIYTTIVKELSIGTMV